MQFLALCASSVSLSIYVIWLSPRLRFSRPLAVVGCHIAGVPSVREARSIKALFSASTPLTGNKEIEKLL